LVEVALVVQLQHIAWVVSWTASGCGDSMVKAELSQVQARNTSIDDADRRVGSDIVFASS
jgi:hypothetical protein